MARKPRIYTDKGIYHIIMRGNNKQNLFHDDNDRNFFLSRLQKYSKDLEIDIYAYCLMNNHVHILLGKAGKNVSLLIQKLANSYVYFFNRKYDRCGHLFQGRFKSEVIQDNEYLKTVYRYILQNCEKAGLGKCENYKWNSYKFLEENNHLNFITSDFIIKIFGNKQILLQFLSQKSTENCMEFENRLIYSDEKAFKIIKKLLGIESPHKLERLKIDEQLQKCKLLKENGFSISQISRITGISKTIIRSA